MAVARTWIGGGHNGAGNPYHWSPTGAPQRGDTLNISQGTINIRPSELGGDTLHVINDYPNPSSVAINASDHSVLTLETEGLGVIPLLVTT